MMRILQRSSMKQSSSLTLSLITAPWRRSPLRQRTKRRESVLRISGVRPGCKESDRQFYQRDAEGKRVDQQHKRVGSLFKIAESLGFRHSNMPRRRSLLSGASKESSFASDGRGLKGITKGES